MWAWAWAWACCFGNEVWNVYDIVAMCIKSMSKSANRKSSNMNYKWCSLPNHSQYTSFYYKFMVWLPMMMLMKYLTNSRISITQYGIWLYHYFHFEEFCQWFANYFSKNKAFICIWMFAVISYRPLFVPKCVYEIMKHSCVVHRKVRRDVFA